MLEIGGGLGVLSEHLAAHAAHVHVVELDRALVPALEDALAPHPNTTLHVADALDLDLGALDARADQGRRQPPYGIAASAILRTIEELDGVTRWVAMVQREVGERFAAAPGTPAYGVPSVLAQLACDVRVHRSIARTVFHPVPNVDSVLVVLDRTGPAPAPEVRALVRAAFAHRRKALARSLALSPGQGPDVRDRARAALQAARPSGRRARRAPRARGVPRARRGGTLAQPRAGTAAALHDSAPAKVNLCLYVGPTREDGRHELVSIFQPIALADEVELEPGGLGSAMDRVICPGVEGENLAALALRRFRERTGWNGGPVRIRIEKRIPIAAGMAGGSADAGAALRLVARAAGIEDDALLREIGAGLGADVAAQVRPRRYLATGAGERLTPLPPPAPYGVLVIPSRLELSTADVYREFDRQGLPRDAADLAARLREVSTAAADLPDELIVNDLEPAARALCPEIDDALADGARAWAPTTRSCADRARR